MSFGCASVESETISCAEAADAIDCVADEDADTFGALHAPNCKDNMIDNSKTIIFIILLDAIGILLFIPYHGNQKYIVAFFALFILYYMSTDPIFSLYRNKKTHILTCGNK